jgi:hypothetical protein
MRVLRNHRRFGLWMIAAVAGFAMLPSACSSDDEENQAQAAEDEKRRLERAKGGTEFVPGEAPSSPPPLPPGAGPYNGPPPIPDTPPPMDSGSTDSGPKDTGSSQDVQAQ